MRHAEVLLERCCRVAGTSSRDSRREEAVQRWALLVYALAGATGQSVESVSVGQVRYRVDVRDEYAHWLHDRLAVMGHAVQPLTLPSFEGGVRSAVASLLSELDAAEQSCSPLSDDPVVARWRQDTLVTARWRETASGATVDLPPSCALWDYQPTMIGLLDAQLLVERGGWRPGSRVRTVGKPLWIGPGGELAGEAGVSGDRAEVGAPVWLLDHETASLAQGPPVAYHLLYRALESGLGKAPSATAIPAEALELDLAPFPDTTGPLIPPRASPDNGHNHADRGLDPTAAAVDRPGRDRSTPGWTVLSTGTTVPEATGVLGVPDDVDAARASAIQRLWTLRDRELARCGDSRPARVAARMVAGALDDPPPSSTTLLAEEQLRRDLAREPTAPWCPPERELVVGHAREHLRQWLHALRWPTYRQRRVLDGLDENSSLSDTLALLGKEGFVETSRVPAWRRQPGGPSEDTPCAGMSGPDGLDLVLVNPEHGWVATVHAPDSWQRGPEVWSVSVHYNAALLDRDLAIAVPWGHLVKDRLGRHTTVACGGFTAHPRNRLTGHGHSIRVALAVLRAFTTPILPWLGPTGIHPGADGAPAHWRRQLLADLPREVHDLIGPNLLAGTPSPGCGPLE